MTKRINLQDRKEEAYAFLPHADQIVPDRTFGKGEGTAQMLMKHTGMSNKAALNNLKRLKAENRAHIHAWTRTANPSEVWVKGQGEDAPRPVPDPYRVMLRDEKKRQREQERREKSGNGATLIDARTRTAQTIERAKQAPRDPFAALFDPAPVQS